MSHKKKRASVSSTSDEKQGGTFYLSPEQKKTLGLTDDILKALKDVFIRLDKDGNGTLDKTELRDAMRTVGVNPSDAEMSEIMKDMDADNNGIIDFYELACMVSKWMSDNDPERELREAFKVFDINGDGFISIDEIRTVAKSMGQALTEEDIQQMMSEADENNDGQLDYSEFAKTWFSQ